MAATQQKRYPQGYIAMGNGDLIQVTNVTHNVTNNGKQKHTLRVSGAGVSMGVTESSLNFDTIIDEAGSERNYWRAVQRGEIHQLRLKIPGGRTIAVDGMFTALGTDIPLDDAVKLSPQFIGKTERQ